MGLGGLVDRRVVVLLPDPVVDLGRGRALCLVLRTMAPPIIHREFRHMVDVLPNILRDLSIVSDVEARRCIHRNEQIYRVVPLQFLAQLDRSVAAHTVPIDDQLAVLTPLAHAEVLPNEVLGFGPRGLGNVGGVGAPAHVGDVLGALSEDVHRSVVLGVLGDHVAGVLEPGQVEALEPDDHVSGLDPSYDLGLAGVDALVARAHVYSRSQPSSSSSGKETS